MKSVEPGRIILLTVETLKLKTILSAQEVDNTEIEFPIKLPELHFQFQDFYRNKTLARMV